jgi:hypothetical protein
MNSIYQVKIFVNPVIAADYLDWLIEHIEGNPKTGILGMLELYLSDGTPIFDRAELFKSEVADCIVLTTNYYLKNEALMLHYEQYFAPKMRTEVPKRFIGKFKINRILFTPRAVGQFDDDLETQFHEHSATLKFHANFCKK